MSRARSLGERQAARAILCAAAAVLLVARVSAQSQADPYSGIGRTPAATDVRAWDIAIGPSGKELPAGAGTARDGAPIYQTKCAVCHGPALEGTKYGPPLIGSRTTLATSRPVRTVGSFWAFATTLWDYINRAMPRAPFKEGSLTANEVYALSAFVLNRNGIIGEGDVMDARTVPQVRMPNRDGFVPPKPDWIWYERSCRFGRCDPR
jgi:mono/diheme cytochrome c family protein